MNQSKTKISLWLKLAFIFSLLLVIFALINFLLTSFQTISILNRSVGEQLLSIAKTATLQINKEELHQLIEGKVTTLEQKKIVKKLFGTLKNIELVNNLEAIYILIKKDNLIRIISEEFKKDIEITEEANKAFTGEYTFIKKFNLEKKSAYAPIYYKKKIIGVLGVDAKGEIISNSLIDIQQPAIIFLFFSVCLALLTSLLIAYSITNPIRSLLVGINRIARGDLEYKLKIKNVLYLPDEITDVAVAFNNMTQSLKLKEEENKQLYDEINQFTKELEKRVKEATAELEEKNRIRNQELKLAEQIQKTLLPTKFYYKNIKIESRFIQAEEIGGDFYTFIPIDKDRIGILIGDVSGRGIPAALLMTMTIGIMQEVTKNNYSTSSALTKANQTLVNSVTSKSSFPDYVSLFYGILDLKERTLTYSKAGHEIPILIRDNNLNFLDAEGTFLGIFNDVYYEEKKIELNKGDKIIFYTDGIFSLKNEKKIRFTETQFYDIIINNGSLEVDKLINKIYNEISSYTDIGTLEDDLALMVLTIE